MRILKPLAVLLVAATVLASAVYAQFWKKKTYEQWSQSECKEMLKQSPWANEYKIAKVIFEAIGASATGGDPTVEGRESAPHVTYRAQIISARPIRQAMMRLQQLDPKYKKMSEEERKTFDQRAAEFIGAQFPDAVVVRLSYSTVQAYRLPLARYWQTQSQEEIKFRFNLICAAGRIAPAQVIVQPAGTGEEAAFHLIFPRMINGKPAADANLKQLGIEVASPGIDGVLPPERVFIPFKVKNMVVEGEVIY